MEQLFTSITNGGTFTVQTFLMESLVSVVIGFLLSLFLAKTEHESQSFLTTILLLPFIVQIVITLVNGNLGAGVAVAGAFSLVRFRSAQGTGREITAIFLAMASGLATGMGQVFVALFLCFVGILILFFVKALRIGEKDEFRTLIITAPEDVDCDDAFDDIFQKYTTKTELLETRTTNMGSLYRMTYHISLKSNTKIKNFVDELRTKNGNLEISIGRKLNEEGKI